MKSQNWSTAGRRQFNLWQEIACCQYRYTPYCPPHYEGSLARIYLGPAVRWLWVQRPSRSFPLPPLQLHVQPGGGWPGGGSDHLQVGGTDVRQSWEESWCWGMGRLWVLGGWCGVTTSSVQTPAVPRSTARTSLRSLASPASSQTSSEVSPGRMSCPLRRPGRATKLAVYERTGSSSCCPTS